MVRDNSLNLLVASSLVPKPNCVAWFSATISTVASTARAKVASAFWRAIFFAISRCGLVPVAEARKNSPLVRNSGPEQYSTMRTSPRDTGVDAVSLLPLQPVNAKAPAAAHSRMEESFMFMGLVFSMFVCCLNFN